VFRLLYLYLEEPASWMAYLQFSVVVGLMALAYLHTIRRRMSFMPLFGVMLAIFFLDFFAYLPFLAYLLIRDRRRGLVASESANRL